MSLRESRRRGSRALAALLLAGLTACASSSSSDGAAGAQDARPPSPGLARIASSREVRIGMSGEQPPLTMMARSGEMIGLDVALARVLGSSMGVETTLVQLPFGRLLDALENREVELVISGLTITPERSQRVTLVGPYYTSGKTILTKSAELAAVTIPQDLDRPDIRLAALAGSTSEAFAREKTPRARLVTTERLEQAIQKVRNGEVDALVADRETCAFAALRHPDEGLIASEAVFTVEPMGVAVAADDPRLARLVESYLTALRDRGVLDKAREFWLKDPSWVKDLR